MNTFALCFGTSSPSNSVYYVPDVKVPSVMFVVGDVNPIVVGDHPLVQRQDCLVPCLNPSHL